MGNIRVLDDHLANQIAAGEVVERPSSVVKELVENAIDAGSRSIDVAVEEGGIQSIRVVDDGSGIEPDDLELAFERHATSKIRSSKDLFAIRSLGFRGEALPSIAAVARVECISAANDGGLGRRLVIEGGKKLALEDTAAPRGTDFRVKDLFYNTPARLKYLKTVQTELGHITDYMYRLALSRPDIKFRLEHNGSLLLDTAGNGDLQQAAAAVYGTATAKRMIPVAVETPDFRIDGWIARPDVTRSNRGGVTVVVNGRFVRNFQTAQAILSGYHTLLPINRYPLAIVRIEMEPSLIDVNVHPAKLEVRFSKEAELSEAIQKAVRDALRKETLIPSGMAGRERRVAPTGATSKPYVVQEQLSLYETRSDGGRSAGGGAPSAGGVRSGGAAAAFGGSATDSAASARNPSGGPAQEAFPTAEARGSASFPAAESRGSAGAGERPSHASGSAATYGVSRPFGGPPSAAVPPRQFGGAGRSASPNAAPPTPPSRQWEPRDAEKVLRALAPVPPVRGEGVSGAQVERTADGTGAPENRREPPGTAAGETPERDAPSAAAMALDARDDATSRERDETSRIRDAAAPGEPDGAYAPEPRSESAAPRFPHLFPIGQLHGTYIVAQNEDGLFLIDQHAAHERINYEAFYKRFGSVEALSQMVLFSHTIEFTSSEAQTLRARLPLLESVGVYLEPFGGNTFKVRSHPSWFPAGDEAALIEEMAQWVLSERSPDVAKIREASAIMASCKASIKANQPQSIAAMEKLLERLATCSNPFTCPHGRPIVVSFGKRDLEKMFKRVM